MVDEQDGKTPVSSSSKNDEPWIGTALEPDASSNSAPPPDTTSFSTAVPGDSATTSSTPAPSMTTTNPLGRSTAAVSDWINDHIVLARGGAFATIGLLTAYGLAVSPLFAVPYRRVSDIPRQAFAGRQRFVVGRIVQVDGPVLRFRPLAPWERYVPLSWATAVGRLHPLQRRRHDDDYYYWPVHVWGITLDPRLAITHQPRVVCQLLARGRKQRSEAETTTPRTKRNPMLQDYKEYMEEDDATKDDSTNNNDSMVVCGTLSLHHRWGADVGERWVRDGRATVATDPGRRVPPGYDVIDECNHASSDAAAKEQQRLLRYVSQRLVPAEYEACAHHRGVWADPVYREERKDVVDEAEFQVKAKWWQRVWRWVRDRAM